MKDREKQGGHKQRGRISGGERSEEEIAVSVGERRWLKGDEKAARYAEDMMRSRSVDSTPIK